MSIKFTKNVPDELHVDTFTQNKSIEVEYDGPSLLYVLVDKTFGNISGMLQSREDNYNRDLFDLVVVDAASTPDVAYLLYNNNIPPERTYETETLVDGTTYEKITNAVLNEYYQVNYDLNQKKWNWKVITVEPKSIRNITCQRYRDYINENIEKIKDDKTLSKVAQDYISKLDAFETTGKGSIPSWKIISAKISDVPMVPQELVAAFNVFP